jgi:hypothetical protein
MWAAVDYNYPLVELTRDLLGHGESVKPTADNH